MSDRELLELAAKAAGIASHWGDGWQSDMMFRSIPRPNSPLVTNVEWNPLNDDGDALRLAVKLQMEVASRSNARADCIGYEIQLEPLNGDPCAATRRAIVRAAAEIGKGMVAQPSGKDLPEDDYYKSQSEAFYGGKP